MRPYRIQWGILLLCWFTAIQWTAPSQPREQSPDALRQLQQQIAQGIDSILRHSPYARTARFALDIRLLPENIPLYQRNVEEPMVPASINKLFITAAALELLGKDFQMPTLLYGDTLWSGDSIYRGNLYLVGSGDPLLTVADLDSLARQLAAKGIRHVTGNLYVDASFFDSLVQRRAYSGDREIVQSTPPITGLPIERNSFIVQITGASRSGRRPKVAVFPPTHRVQVLNRAVTRSGRYSSRRIKVRSRILPSGRQQLIVYGKISRRRVVRKRVYMEFPDLIAGELLKTACYQRGIRIEGVVQRRSLTNPAVILAHIHHPLAKLIEAINHESDNYYAEQLFKMIGGYLSSFRFHTNAAKARLYLQQFLSSNDIVCSQCQFRDGSGLSRRNQLAARAVTDLLATIPQKPYADLFIRSLSVAGRIGTLRKRLRFHPAAGAIFGKTGTLRNVSGLAGYILNRSGTVFAFTILFSGRHISHYKDLEDQITAFLALLPLPPSLAPPALTGPLPLRSLPQPFFSKLHALFPDHRDYGATN